MEDYNVDKWVGSEAISLAIEISMVLKNPRNVETDLRKIMRSIKDWKIKKDQEHK